MCVLFHKLLCVCVCVCVFSSVAQSCLTPCDPMDCSTPGFLVYHQLSELALVHRVSVAIQPSHPVFPFSCLQSFPASGSFQISQFFTSSGQSIGVSASVLPKNIQFPYSMDLLDFLAVQGALKGLLQHHSSKLTN